MMFPFSERVTCTVSEACAASGLGRTKIYEVLADGRLQSIRVDRRRLIVVKSLLKLLEPEQRRVAA